jgi:CheY-like chemotaxis protein
MTALRKLLVVDDDPVVGASFNRVLSGKGYIVVSAENGADALAKLQSEKFDAVFTDLRMPGMDGLQVAEKVRAAQPWTPVVIVTGYGSPASEARARAAGVSDFLNKPLSPEMIEESADKAVRTVFEGVSAPPTEQEAQAASIAAVAIAEAAESAAAAAPAEEARPGALTLLKNMALFLAAPFIGLAYAVLLPFVGLGLLVYAAVSGKKEAAAEGAATLEAPVAEAPAALAAAAPAAEVGEAAGAPAEPAALTVAKLVAGVIAAPFIGLAYIIVMPFAGLAALAWLGMKAAFARAG